MLGFELRLIVRDWQMSWVVEARARGRGRLTVIRSQQLRSLMLIICTKAIILVVHPAIFGHWGRSVHYSPNVSSFWPFGKNRP